MPRITFVLNVLLTGLLMSSAALVEHSLGFPSFTPVNEPFLNQ